MRRAILLLLLLTAAFVSHAQTSVKTQDYVPDEKTAVRIAEAVLVARYGEESVNAQLPLHAIDNKADYWIVQGHGPAPATSKGGGPAVWINKHSGCLKITDRMK
jgi:hypothetical protein